MGNLLRTNGMLQGSRKWLRAGKASRGWLVILPTLLILGLVLGLSRTTKAAPAPRGQSLGPALSQQAEVSSSAEQLPSAQQPAQQLPQQSPTCQTCHPEAYAVWKDSKHASATLDPVFQEQLSKAHDQQACMACHTTGFDSGSGKFLAEGVTCEACHGPYKEGHPAAQTMQLPMASDTCRMCHQAAFKEWETSQHAAKNIECFDCHLSHTQGLRTGSQEKLCSACHSDQNTDLAHSQHGINGVNCTSCHMAKAMKTTGNPSGAEIEASSHSFTVAADVCNQCHGSTIHTSAKASGTQQLVALTSAKEAAIQPAAPSPQTAGDSATTEGKHVAELQGQVTELQARLTSLRDTAVIGIGLAFGVGAFMGLVIGLVGMGLWKRSRRSA